MENERYCDMKHVIGTLEQCQEIMSEGELVVLDCEYVMRGISNHERKKRNIPMNIDSIVCYIEWDSGPVYKFKFHQNEMSNALKLNPAPVDALYPVQQATEPKDLGKRLAFVQKQLDCAYDCGWDLAKVQAGSIANGGYLTSYEFEYDFMKMDD